MTTRGAVAGKIRGTIEGLREANAGLMKQLTSAQNLGQEWQDRCLAMQTERDSARHMHEVTVALLDQAATDYRKDRDAAQAESDEWRDTARSEMAGRAAAEAEVARLEGLLRRLVDGIDAWNAEVTPIIGRPVDYKWPALEEARDALAPEEKYPTAEEAEACRKAPGKCVCGAHITELGDWPIAPEGKP
jgi:hypothetical protein